MFNKIKSFYAVGGLDIVNDFRLWIEGRSLANGISAPSLPWLVGVEDLINDDRHHILSGVAVAGASKRRTVFPLFLKASQ